tara:strand:- start:525 stop:743 length:219 start_codon:yes stop_codon:yes gene_type:complete
MKAQIMQYKRTGAIPVDSLIKIGIGLADFIVGLVGSSRGQKVKVLTDLVGKQAEQIQELNKRVTILEQFERL